MKLFKLALSSTLLAACSGQNASKEQTSDALSAKATATGVYSLIECKLSQNELRDFHRDNSINGDQNVNIRLKIDSDGSKTLSGTIVTPSWADELGKTNPAVVAEFASLPIAKVEYLENRRGPHQSTLNISGEMSITSEGKSSKVKLNKFVIFGSYGSDEFAIGFSNDFFGNNYGIKPLLDYQSGKCDYKNMKLLKTLSKK